MFLFKRLLDILLHAVGEEVTPSSDTAVTAERKFKQGKKQQKRKRLFTVSRKDEVKALCDAYSSPAVCLNYSLSFGLSI